MQLVDALDRPIAFHRCFVTITGSITAALMLSQALYWSKRSKDPEGWFYKTAEEWTEETGMVRSEVENARKRLKIAGFISEKRKGQPAKLFYKVNAEAIQQALQGRYRELEPEEVISLFGGAIQRASNLAFNRAQRCGVVVQQVDYTEVLRRHGMVCHICGEKIVNGLGLKPRDLSFDHVVPISKNGPHTYDNIKPAHFGCNDAASDEDKTARRSQSSLPDTSNLDAPDATNLDRSDISKLDASDNYKQDPPAAGKLDRPDTDKLKCPTQANYIGTETTTEITTETTAEREDDSPALSAIDDLANTLFSLYQIPDNAGWRLRDLFQSLAMELHGLGATPAEVRDFYASRAKKPGVEFFARDFVPWRASQTGGAAGSGVRSAQRQQASARAKEILFGGGDKR
jgi:hypothetical protein